MPIGPIILYLVIIGLILYLINNYLPIDAKIKTIINVVIVVFLIIWLFNLAGGLTGFHP